MHAAHQHQHGVLHRSLQRRRLAVQAQLLRESHVVAMDGAEQHDHQDRHYPHDPRALGPFLDGNNGEHDSRRQRPDAVHHRFEEPSRAALSPPVDDHAGLREREGGEDAQGVQRDQPVDVAPEDDNQHPGEETQQHDPVREDQPVSPVGELARQEAVVRQDRTEAGKIGEAGVCRQQQDRGRRDLHRVVEPHPRAGAAEDGAGELIDDRWRRLPILLPVDDVQ